MTKRKFNEIPEDRRRVARGIEVGQIFYFGTKYSESDGGNSGRQRPQMAKCRFTWARTGLACRVCWGLSSKPAHDDKGIIWPEGVTPFHCGHREPETG